MPFRKLTPVGSLPPSWRYLWTASRPVNNVPDISTGSPTFSERMSASSQGVLSFIMPNSVKPAVDLTIAVKLHALTSIRPAHVADAHKKRGRKAIGGANLHAEQGRFAAESHRADAKFVRRVQDVLLEFVQFGNRVAVFEA